MIDDRSIQTCALYWQEEWMSESQYNKNDYLSGVTTSDCSRISHSVAAKLAMK